MQHKNALTLIFLTTCCLICNGQFHNHWIIGDSIYVEFNAGVPEFRSTVPFNSNEACASIADSTGKLLFYTNSKRIWNRDFELMLNGDSINFQPESLLGSTVTQGAMIIPSIIKSNQYFVLSIDARNIQLEYSVVDMTLDGGLGGVVDSLKCVTLYEGFNTEQLQAIRHGNGRDWWIVFRAGLEESDSLMSILLSPVGFSDPQFQKLGDVQGFQGEFVLSSDGSILVHVSKNMVQLFDYDRCSGVFSNPRRIPIDGTIGYFYGGAFSPSDEILYFSSLSGNSLYQVDLSNLEDSSSVLNIFRLGGAWNEAGQLEKGPDGLIYMAFGRIDTTMGFEQLPQHLGVVRNPDVIGLACQFDTFGVWLGGRENRLTLPNTVNFELGALEGSDCDSLNADTMINIVGNFLITPIRVFPTISSGIFYMSSKHPISQDNIAVVDLSSRQVKFKYYNKRIDIRDAPAGVYILSITHGKYKKTFKLIKR